MSVQGLHLNPEPWTCKDGGHIPFPFLLEALTLAAIIGSLIIRNCKHEDREMQGYSDKWPVRKMYEEWKAAALGAATVFSNDPCQATTIVLRLKSLWWLKAAGFRHKKHTTSRVRCSQRGLSRHGGCRDCYRELKSLVARM